jgi:hypothetical protein
MITKGDREDGIRLVLVSTMAIDVHLLNYFDVVFNLEYSLIKKKIQFSSYIRKFRRDRLKSHR